MGRDFFGPPHAKWNAGVAPAMAEETGAGDAWALRLACVLPKGKIARSHEGERRIHDDARFVHLSRARRFLGAVTKDEGHQAPDFFHIGRSGPTTNQAIAQVADIGWVMKLCGHFASKALHKSETGNVILSNLEYTLSNTEAAVNAF
jgi:hypothetical protein